MGRRWPIGCVALEITQRCNLDCTVCYLSENSEAVKDLPLEEVFRRIDMIFDHYITHNKCHAKYNDLCNAISNFARRSAEKLVRLCDSVTDNFRVIDPKGFRVLKA